MVVQPVLASEVGSGCPGEVVSSKFLSESEEKWLAIHSNVVVSEIVLNLSGGLEASRFPDSSETDEPVEAVGSEVEVSVLGVLEKEDSMGAVQLFSGNVVVEGPGSVEVVVVLQVLLPEEGVLLSSDGGEFKLYKES